MTKASGRATVTWMRDGGLAIVGLGVVLGLFVNLVLPHIDVEGRTWTASVYLFEQALPVGLDFRDGTYNPAGYLLEGKSPYVESWTIYPPLAGVVGIPFHLFPLSTAYMIQVWLLFALNVGTIGLAAWAVGWTAEGEAWPMADAIRRVAVPVALAISVWLIGSYGFWFSIERGNTDIYAGFLSVVGLCALLRRPDRVGVALMCFSLAANLKIYPAILFLLLLGRGRGVWWKLLAVNVGLLLITGPDNALRFTSLLGDYLRSFAWGIGNHSAMSFGWMVGNYLEGLAAPRMEAEWFYVPPLALWVVGVIQAWKHRSTGRGILWFFILSVPMMNLIPSTSHDYKLVLLGAPMAMALCLWLGEREVSGRALMTALILITVGASIALARSYTLTPSILGNKYPWILLFEACVVAGMLAKGRRPRVTERIE